MKLSRVLIICIAIPFTSYGQIQLFEKDVNNKIVATVNPENTIGLKLNHKERNRIITLREDSFLLSLPFLGSNHSGASYQGAILYPTGGW